MKEKIILSAIQCFSKQGFSRTRMDDVALSAQLSKGTLYNYFENKEELFYAICDDSFNLINEQLKQIFTSNRDELINNAGQIYENYRKVQKEGIERVFFEAIAESSRNPRLQQILREHRLKIFKLSLEYLQLQVKNGTFSQTAGIEFIASGIVSLFDGLTIGKILGISEDYNKRVWAETIKSILSSLS